MRMRMQHTSDSSRRVLFICLQVWTFAFAVAVLSGYKESTMSNAIVQTTSRGSNGLLFVGWNQDQG